MTSATRRVAVAAAVLGFATLMPRSAAGVIVNFSVGNFFQNNLGNAGVPGGFDMLTLTGRSGFVDLTPGIPLTTIISDLKFDAGDTGIGSPGIYNFTASYALTAGGVVGAGGQSFTLTVAPSVDTLQLFAASPLVFDLGASGLLSVTALSSGPFSGRVGAPALGTIPAQFTLAASPAAVPEPSSGALLLAAVAILGWSERCRRCRAPVPRARSK